MAKKTDEVITPTSRLIATLLDALEQQARQIADLHAWKDKVEAAWPQIAGVRNGAD